MPGILGLIQGVGGNAQCVKNNKTNPDDRDFIEYFPPPRFSIETFFIIVSSLFIAALIAFILLDQLKSIREEYAANVVIGHGNKFKYHDHHDEGDSNSEEKASQIEKTPNETERVKKISVANYRGLLVLLGAVCMFVNAIFPSVMPFGEYLRIC